ncbi:NAD(P)/FAD-dependent oxidoreductase [Hwangdonia seohaensis]|uniref:Geranylgeranyl reductase family protein n=1 Tax=Hwangdonia seohaensis TaxID=1240727 RepID=A0ABW3RE82_9FLAO|nr:NAD(P)/FAD-dependent oxidoreductase [Hwangdonia seohaensis]
MIQIRPKIDFDCDVLIVGGGPAGSALAHHLSKMNIKTIVVEAERFPRDKVCGDGVSPIALKELHDIGITQTEAFKKANSIEKVGLFLNKDQTFIQLEKPETLPFHARIIPRIELDYMVYKAAKSAGAQFIENARVVDFKVSAHKVVTTYKKGASEKEIISKLIVGADGSRSLVGRKLRGNMPDPAYQLLGLRSYFKNVNGPKNRVDVYFSKENFPGIYWLFPKGENGANVGMAMVFKTCPQQASEVRKCFSNFIESNPDLKKRLGKGKAIEKIQGWPITFYNSQNPIISHRAMLIGEAAGLINPLSGDGIQYAVLSARWASVEIKKCSEQNDFSYAAMAGYQTKIESELEYDFALSNLLVQFGRNKTLSPLWMSFLKILIARCKEDPKFAGTIAGIFEGTYPSYKALRAEFILKIAMQAGIDANSYILNRANQPAQFVKDGSQFAKTSKDILIELSKDPKAHLGWLADVAGKTFKVAKHTLNGK